MLLKNQAIGFMLTNNIVSWKESKVKKMRVSIIGSGIVGTVTGTGLAKLGNSVIFYDVDKNRIQSLSNSSRHSTSQINEAIAESDISFVSVPTPFDGKQMDLSFVMSAVSAIAESLA